MSRRDEFLRRRWLARQRALPGQSFEYRIRPATARDIPDIREIYNHYVANSVVTFDEKRWSHRQWVDKFDHIAKLGLPFLVAESATGQLLGYALVTPWSGKSSFRYTAEVSIYLGPGATGKGLGDALLGALVEASRRFGLRQIVAVIADSGAEASVALHRKHGFVEVGRLGRVGFKFGRWVGVIHMQRQLAARRRWFGR